MDVAETERLQQEVVDGPRHSRRYRHHEDHRAGHSDCGLGLLRDAQEGAAPKKAVQDEVVHENRADNYDEVSHGNYYSISWPECLVQSAEWGEREFLSASENRALCCLRSVVKNEIMTMSLTCPAVEYRPHADVET